MSHPLIVEAIEDLFHPVFVFNNKKKDVKLLKRFKERAWNNPVVRFLGADGKDLVPRKDRVWKTGAVAARMIEALKAAKRDVPKYLRAVAAESAAGLKTATFAMSCFWTGEEKLGSIDGVVRTRCAWVKRYEVVEVIYDPGVVEYEKLVKAAQEMKCARKVFCHDDAQLAVAKKIAGTMAEKITAPARRSKPSDQKIRIRRHIMSYLPLTPMQATKINAFYRAKKHLEWLSPRQVALGKKLGEAYKKNKTVLKGLKRPEKVEELDEYEEELRALPKK